MVDFIFVLDVRETEGMVGVDVYAEWAAVIDSAEISVSKDVVETKAVVALFVHDNVVEIMVVWVFFEQLFDGSSIEVINVIAGADEIVVWIVNLFLVGCAG